MDTNRLRNQVRRIVSAAAGCAFAAPARGQGPSQVNLEDAIRLALRHNHSLAAARTTIQQSLAGEITANLRPNPSTFAP